jgi:predicted N-acyltransferase
MAYTYRLFASINDVDLIAWERLRVECGASVFLDPRFIGAVETSMRENCRFWYVIVYQEDGRPVACACLTGMAVDLANFADPGLAWVMHRLPAWLSRLRHWKLMFCGFPVSTGHHALALAPQCASQQILSMLDGVIDKLALEMGADAVVYREFEQDDLEWANPLLKLGYHRVATPPAHFFKPSFNDLQHYCAALKSHYRKQIKRSMRKLEQAGVKTTILTEPEQILKVYTPGVHGLYHQMRDRAETKFDTLSIDFLRELPRRLGHHVNLILLADGPKIFAFGWCLRTNSHFHMMYAGLDYALNEKLDLYFNLHYAALDCALRYRVSKIELGLTAESFKARLGCYSEPLYVFMKGLGPLMSFMVRCGANLLFTQTPATPPFDVFKSSIFESPK